MPELESCRKGRPRSRAHRPRHFTAELGLGTLSGTLLEPAGGDGAGMDDVGQAEYATLGSLMLALAGLDRVAPWLQPTDFRDSLGGEVFGLLLAMRKRSAVIDPVTVLGELRRRGRLGGDGAAGMALVRMVESVPVPGAVASYGRLVLAASIGRQLEAAGSRLAQVGRARRGEPTDWLDRATAELAALAAARRGWDDLDRPARRRRRAGGVLPAPPGRLPAGLLHRPGRAGRALDRRRSEGLSPVGELDPAGEARLRQLLAGAGPDGERLVPPVWRSDPRSRLPAAPLVAAMTAAAAYAV